jgi:DNA processing protein
VQVEGDAGVVGIGEQCYPPRLRGIPSPPSSLFVHGRAQVLAMPRLLAVVGSRRASAAGLATTRQLCAQVASVGAGIVSGLAEGIDAAAHAAALAVDTETIAVLGGGLDEISPLRNRPLAEKIVAAGGALISEQTPGMPALSRHLVARNRLISGMAAAVLIIECEPASGTLHTARFAVEQGRPIFVPPPDRSGKMEEGMRLLRERFGARSFDEKLLAEACAAPVPATDPASGQLRLEAE